MRKTDGWVVAAALSLPGLYQLTSMFAAMSRRFPYPYDLEWMEGGMLGHALRYAAGLDIYVAPTVEFIAYPYTPLYPAVLAALSSVFDLSYQLGRGVSILSTLGILAMIVWAAARGTGTQRSSRAQRWALGISACGVFAATYPWVDGWFDLVRNDMLFVALVMAGLCWLAATAVSGERSGRRLHLSIAGSALILALSFFAKQTGVLYVVAGGAALLLLKPRGFPTFVLVSGAVGLGGSVLYDKLSEGWFWTFAYEMHQRHGTQRDVFWSSFATLFLAYPVAHGVLLLSAVLVAVRRLRCGRWPPDSRGYAFWIWIYFVSVIVGATGHATPYAFLNAFIPSMAFVAMALVWAIPAAARSWADIAGDGRLQPAISLVLIAALGAQLVAASWEIDRLVPTDEDEGRVRAFVETLERYPGDVYVPSHPWYARLAGKRVYAHRMGVQDFLWITQEEGWQDTHGMLETLIEAIRERRFSAVVVNYRDLVYFPRLEQSYARTIEFPEAERLRIVSGFETAPIAIWEPRR